MVHLQHVADKYKEDGVAVLGFNTADIEDKVRELMAQKKVSFPCVVDSSDGVRQIATGRYGSSSVPMNYIIDREGKVALAFAGYSKGDRRGVEAIEALLAGRKVERLREPKSVFGQVLMADGSPLAGASVSLFQSGGRGNYRGTTDGEGNYEIADVPAGEYRVLVGLYGGQGFSCPGGTVVVVADKAVQHGVKLGGGVIEGRVVLKKDGTPLRHLDVSIVARPGHYFATPDENGRYRLVGLPPGAYTISVNPKLPTVRRATRAVDVDGVKKDVDFSLESVRTGKLRLQVLDANGKPARDLEFSVDIPGGTRGIRGKYVEEGVWEFELEVGARVIRIDGSRQTIDVEISEGKTARKKVTLR